MDDSWKAKRGVQTTEYLRQDYLVFKGRIK